MDSKSVKEFIRQEVPDWDEESIATARFKAFSGQKSDWEPKFQFWKSLITNISRHFGAFIISPSQMKNEWFNRGGLTPLCIDQEKADDVVKCLSESHWNSNCIVTRTKFESMCRGQKEAYAVLSYLSGWGERLISLDQQERTNRVVSGVSSLDFDVLHLIWTQEKLQQQLDVMDRRWEMTLVSCTMPTGSEVQITFF
ncbi:SNF7 family protein, putative isoform 2 [Hibiscus syriacus]|uniref:SNF7 family protein, putative isoform 2 n=1 Tax=Hibiscus syriacus TaxID=106335 RepID=A0A6A3AAI6_HIBSY|nr:SNF7 family protein, putative isoform 2 [Hibiscus syriacus]